MSSQTKYAGGGASLSVAPWWTTPAWSNPGNIISDNASYASVVAGVGTASQFLMSSSHGFTIPDGAEILGIEVKAQGKQSSTKAISLSDAYLTKNGSSITGTGKTQPLGLSTSETIFTWGGSTSLWGTTWTVAEINAATFGACIDCVNYDVATATAYVDYITITVYYNDAEHFSASATVNIGLSATASRTIDLHLTSAVAIGTYITFAFGRLNTTFIEAGLVKFGLAVSGSAGKHAFGFVLKRIAKFASKTKTVRFIE